jgi:pimeloyl-ACP methyl ester carboxylesterase
MSASLKNYRKGNHVMKVCRRGLLFFAMTFAFVLAGIGGTGVSPVIHAQDAHGTSHFAKLDGARIHYVNYGKGEEALVLIHGWTQNIDAWRDNIPDFAGRYRVIAIDLPGHGQSDKPGEAKSKGESAKGKNDASPAGTLYSMDHFARAVEAVMRDAKVKRAVLVGHSMGTPVARQFYRKYPDKTLAIVIVDGSLRPFGNKAMLDQMIAGFRGPG